MQTKVRLLGFPIGSASNACIHRVWPLVLGFLLGAAACSDDGPAGGAPQGSSGNSSTGSAGTSGTASPTVGDSGLIEVDGSLVAPDGAVVGMIGPDGAIVPIDMTGLDGPAAHAFNTTTGVLNVDY